MKQVSINDALSEIESVLATVMVTGAVDSEPSDFAAIKAKIIDGDISPSDGIEKVRQLVDSRQSYH